MDVARKRAANPLRPLALTGFLAIIVAFLVYLVGPVDLWRDAIADVIAIQRDLHRELAAAMRGVADHGALAGWTLVVVSFLYGVFHAAGPGHGKAVITTYLATQKGERRAGLILATTGALLQGVTAVAAVEIVVGIFASSFRNAQSVTTRLEQMSYVLVALLGVWLLIVSARRLWSGVLTNRNHAAADCLHHHHQAAPGPGLSWWAALLSIGIRPCSGAILVLVLAHSLGLRPAGIAAVFAMAAGTALAVSLLALITVHARDWALRWSRHLSGNGRTLQIGGNIVALGGGAMILLLGVSLLLASMATATHPLMGAS